jgi:hypothetical protein
MRNTDGSPRSQGTPPRINPLVMASSKQHVEWDFPTRNTGAKERPGKATQLARAHKDAKWPHTGDVEVCLPDPASRDSSLAQQWAVSASCQLVQDLPQKAT